MSDRPAPQEQEPRPPRRRRGRGWRIAAAATAVALLAVLAAPATANHPQAIPNGGTLTFDHKSGGNEWWVEVVVTSSVAVSKVEVMDTGGAWATMAAHPEWGAGTYSLSYRVEAGHLVTFRATTANGVVTSCAFTHPGGVEQCSTPPPPPPPPGTFDATFNSVRGNQYWVQAQVLANSGNTIAKVDVTMDGGATWKPLAKQSWGTNMYAASYNMPQGTVVQLRATSGAGATDVSACYQWIPAKDTNAATVACGTVPPPPSGFEWHGYFVDLVPGIVGEMSIGDADRDGKSELYYSSSEGIFRRTATTETIVSNLGGALTVGDADNDGKSELYVATGTTVRRLSWSGSTWSETTIHADVPGAYLAQITVGDADNDGLREVYVARGFEGDTTLLRIAKGSAGWSGAVVADLGDDGKFLDPNAIWIGDGDADGKLEVVILTQGYGYGAVHLVEKTASGWTYTDVGGWGGASTYGIVAGDVDADGKGEIAVLDDLGNLLIYRLTAAGWTEQEIPAVPGFGLDLFLGDGDNDNVRELYGSTAEGGLYRLQVRNGAVQRTTLADFVEGYAGAYSVVVGDGDGDGRREVFSEFYHAGRDQTTLYRSEYEAKQTFTFSEAKGNNWWLEVRITSNYPIHAVMATFNCDTGTDPADMTYRADIGKWVLGNTYIPSGTKVTFSASGEWGSAESQGFIHPNGTPTTGC